MTAQREIARCRDRSVPAAENRNLHVVPRFTSVLLSPTRVSGTFPDGMAAVKRDAARRTDEVLGDLVELGLTPNESRAYVALLRLGTATAAEIAGAARIPRQKVYEALHALEQRGFLRMAAAGVTAHTPVAPQEALPAWVRQREHERRIGAERDELLAERLLRALPRPKHPQPNLDEMQAVVGRARTSEVLEQLVERATKTLHMMQQPPFLQARSRWNLAEAAAARRGVQVRVLYSDAAADDTERWRPLVAAGGEARATTEVPMKLLVRDGVEAMISLRDPATGEQGLASAVIRHPDLVGPLQLLFDREWRRARKLVVPQRRARAGR